VTDKVGKYITWLRGTDKENITVMIFCFTRLGLKSYIQFYRETIDTITVTL
jgi:hypothetical protein